MTHVGVTVWWLDPKVGECEDSFSYYGPAPQVGDIFAIDIERVDRDRFDTDAPDGLYLVQQRTLVYPAMGWQILIVQAAVDAEDEDKQTSDDSDEEDSE